MENTVRIVHIPGTQVCVNPTYVTNVRPYRRVDIPELKSVLEVEGNAGYRTREVPSSATVEELVNLLNGDDS